MPKHVASLIHDDCSRGGTATASKNELVTVTLETRFESFVKTGILQICEVVMPTQVTKLSANTSYGCLC